MSNRPAFRPVARAFLVRAAVLAALFLVAHAAGLRRFTGFVSGTLEPGPTGRTLAVFLGTGYIVLWFAVTAAVPILLIAAGLLMLLNRIRR